MKTKLTVNTGTTGTLKQNRNLTGRLMRFTATLFLAGFAFGAMSFTQEDTTKKEEEKTITQITSAKADSCCTITFVSGIQHIVITNRNPFNADVRINDMDINTWVNSMMAYSYKKIQVSSMGLADNKMDAQFTKTEMLNRKLAVAYTKNLEMETSAADAELMGVFNKNVAAPLYSKQLTAQANEADRLADVSFNDEVENRVKAVQFGKSIRTEKEKADGEMDFMLQTSVLKNFTPGAAVAADQQMDQLIQNGGLKKIHPVTAEQADKGIDVMINNKN